MSFFFYKIIKLLQTPLPSQLLNGKLQYLLCIYIKSINTLLKMKCIICRGRQVKLNYEPDIRVIPFFSALAFTSHTCTHTKCFALVMKRGKQWLVNSCLGASYPEVLCVNEQSLVEDAKVRAGRGSELSIAAKLSWSSLVFWECGPPKPLGWRLKILFSTCLWGLRDVILNLFFFHCWPTRDLWHCDCWDLDTNCLVYHSFCLNLGFSCSPPWPDW